MLTAQKPTIFSLHVKMSNLPLATVLACMLLKKLHHLQDIAGVISSYGHHLLLKAIDSAGRPFKYKLAAGDFANYPSY